MEIDAVKKGTIIVKTQSVYYPALNKFVDRKYRYLVADVWTTTGIYDEVYTVYEGNRIKLSTNKHDDSKWIIDGRGAFSGQKIICIDDDLKRDTSGYTVADWTWESAGYA